MDCYPRRKKIKCKDVVEVVRLFKYSRTSTFSDILFVLEALFSRTVDRGGVDTVLWDAVDGGALVYKGGRSKLGRLKSKDKILSDCTCQHCGGIKLCGCEEESPPQRRCRREAKTVVKTPLGKLVVDGNVDCMKGKYNKKPRCDSAKTHKNDSPSTSESPKSRKDLLKKARERNAIKSIRNQMSLNYKVKTARSCSCSSCASERRKSRSWSSGSNSSEDRRDSIDAEESRCRPTCSEDSACPLVGLEDSDFSKSSSETPTYKPPSQYTDMDRLMDMIKISQTLWEIIKISYFNIM